MDFSGVVTWTTCTSNGVPSAMTSSGAGSGVSFDRWRVIFAAISTDTDPGLSTVEEGALLASGFLRKKLVVGH